MPPCRSVHAISARCSRLHLEVSVAFTGPLTELPQLEATPASEPGADSIVHASHQYQYGPSRDKHARVVRLQVKDRSHLGRHSSVLVYCYDAWATQLRNLPKGCRMSIEGSADGRVFPSGSQEGADHPFCLVLSDQMESDAEGLLRLMLTFDDDRRVQITAANVGKVPLGLSDQRPGADGRKRKRAPPARNGEEYSYAKLREVEARKGQLLNVYATVTAFSAPKKTRGRDYLSSLYLNDDSLPDPESAIVCNSFKATRATLPHAKYVGDVVRVHRAKSQLYEGKPQLLGGVKCSFIVCRGWTQSPRRASIKEENRVAIADKADAADTVWRDVVSHLPDGELEVVPFSKSFTFVKEDAKRLLRTWHYAQHAIATDPIIKSDKTRTIGSLDPPLSREARSKASEHGNEHETEIDLIVMLVKYETPPLGPGVKSLAEFVTDDAVLINDMWEHAVGPSLIVWDGTGEYDSSFSGHMGADGKTDTRPWEPWTKVEVDLVQRRLKETANARAPTLEECGIEREDGDLVEESTVLEPFAGAPESFWTSPSVEAKDKKTPQGRRLRICLGNHWKYLVYDLGAEVGDWIRLRGVFVKHGDTLGQAAYSRSAWIRQRSNIMMVPDYSYEVRDLLVSYAYRMSKIHTEQSAAEIQRPARSSSFGGRRLSSLAQVLADRIPAKHVVKVDIVDVSPKMEDWESWIVQDDGEKQLLFELHLQDDTASIRASCSGEEALRFLDVDDSKLTVEDFAKDTALRETIFRGLRKVMGREAESTGAPLKFYLYLESFEVSLAEGTPSQTQDESQEEEYSEFDLGASQSQGGFDILQSGILPRTIRSIFSPTRAARNAVQPLPQRSKHFRIVSTQMKNCNSN